MWLFVKSVFMSWIFFWYILVKLKVSCMWWKSNPAGLNVCWRSCFPNRLRSLHLPGKSDIFRGPPEKLLIKTKGLFQMRHLHSTIRHEWGGGGLGVVCLDWKGWLNVNDQCVFLRQWWISHPDWRELRLAEDFKRGISMHLFKAGTWMLMCYSLVCHLFWSLTGVNFLQN